ncbi:MAG TPA: HEAT repeat domain-containing protein [Bryobacteraceae bacterium]|nr:HEAT repeat domain-containing protein [Bryobacteraceae bacterium]
MEAQIEQLVESFESNPWAAGKALRDMVKTGNGTFSVHALALIKAAPEAPGCNYLLTLLSAEAAFLDKLCDPAVISPAEALEIARRIQKLDANFDARVLRHIAGGGSGSALNEKTAERLLEMVPSFSELGRMLPLLAQLLRHANPRIRSKAVLLAGRAGMGSKLAETCLRHEDKRVRANAVEALWEKSGKEARAILQEATADSDNRVAANAVMGLYKLGDTLAIGLVEKMARHSSAAFRGSAAWVVKETGDPRFLKTLSKLVSDGDAKVRQNVFRALASIRQKKATLGGVPARRVSVVESEIVADGPQRLLVSVRAEDGSPARGLTALQFHLEEAREAITEYSVREKPAPDSIAMGFAFPEFTEPERSFLRVYDEAVQRRLPWTRRQDKWIVREYETDSLAAKMGRLMGDLSQKESHRHLLLVDCPELYSGISEDDADKLLVRAKSAGIRVHLLVVAPIESVPNPRVERLCRSSGGRVTRVADRAEIPEVVQELYCSLLCSYEIAYTPKGSEPGAVSVQVSGCPTPP